MVDYNNQILCYDIQLLLYIIIIYKNVNKTWFLQHCLQVQVFEQMSQHKHLQIISLFAVKMLYLGFSSRPALPVCWIYDSMSSGMPKWITCLTSGQSMPIPNEIVAHTILRGAATSENDFEISVWILLSVQLENISTNQKRERSGASIGYVKPSPRPFWKYMYSLEHSSKC